MALSQGRKLLFGCGGVLVAAVALCAAVVGPCFRSGLRYGMWVDQCPEGEVVPTGSLQSWSLGRGVEGTVEVRAVGHYWNPRWESEASASMSRFDTELLLVDAAGTETLLVPSGKVRSGSGYQEIPVTLPGVPDGDYVLRARLDTAAGPTVVDAPVALYEPALAHVLTDAPIYKPGQIVRFRGVLFGRVAMRPLESRPLVWRVYDPSGELVLQEKARTGAFGVADSDFPLDPAAARGAWRVVLQSGAAEDSVTVQVEPFELPRFTVDVKSLQGWWRIGETPEIELTARYKSGAPVANAPVQLRLAQGSEGRWRAPLAWASPRTLMTDGQGRLRVRLDPVPGDLVDLAELVARVSVSDPAGDQQGGVARIVLSEHALVASAVTELEDGLVVGANNRMFVRVTSPDGQPLANTPLRLRRAWDPDDIGVEARTDADAVALFQLNPGRPVTVVDRPVPVRRAEAELPPPAELQTAELVPEGESLSIADRASLDGWVRALGRCADVLPSTEDYVVTVYAMLDQRGGVEQLFAEGDGNSAAVGCATEVLRGQRGPSGATRVWKLSFVIHDQRKPWLEMDTAVLSGPPLARSGLFETALGRARACVSGVTEPLMLEDRLWFRTSPASSRLDWSRAARGGDAGVLPGPVGECVTRAFTSIELDELRQAPRLGYVDLSVEVPTVLTAELTPAATWQGFSFVVEAGQGENVQAGVLQMREGKLPNLRLRVSETVVDPGAEVELTALRGPQFSGSFPIELTLQQAGRTLVKFPFDPEKRLGRFTVPDGTEGFVSVEWGGARAILYVKPARSLTLRVTPDAEVYRPGSTAKLLIRSVGAQGPVAAGVTLLGVDGTLGMLASLPGADDFARTTVRPTTGSSAFGVLDARALQTGQIMGDNAAQATVLRLEGLPPPEATVERVVAAGESSFDANGPLADAFYQVYDLTRRGVRQWEEGAPKDEKLTAQQVMRLWDEALDETNATDVFGRPLNLGNLPSNLLELCDPRFIVGNTTRLPEDVENWAAFVAAES